MGGGSERANGVSENDLCPFVVTEIDDDDVIILGPIMCRVDKSFLFMGVVPNAKYRLPSRIAENSSSSSNKSSFFFFSLPKISYRPVSYCCCCLYPQVVQSQQREATCYCSLMVVAHWIMRALRLYHALTETEMHEKRTTTTTTTTTATTKKANGMERISSLYLFNNYACYIVDFAANP